MKYAVEPSLIPQIKSEYVQGKGSIREVCEKYGVIDYNPIKVRSSKEKWKEQRETHLTSIADNSVKKAQTKVEAYLQKVSCRGEKYQDLIDKSIEILVGEPDENGKLANGIDPDAIAGYSRALKQLDDVVRRSLGLSDVNVDLKSGGKDIGESIVSALAKLKATDYKPLSSEEMKLAIECEVVPD